MIKKGRQLTKRQNELTFQFKTAYERLSYNHRRMAKQLFCEGFCIVGGTFDNKVSGNNPVAQSEVDWMERIAANPIKELSQSATA
ncbi:hypothetical protein GCM10027592_29060 [Spirosoma flavus]